MWYTHGPGGVPLPLAVGHVPPPEGQTIIDGVTIDDAIAQGWWNPDNTYGMRAVDAVWNWARELG